MEKVKKFFYSALICGVFSLTEAFGPFHKGADLYYGQPTSSFISRWSFQLLCDHTFDTKNGKYDLPTSLEPGGVSFNPLDVKVGDIIFVRRIDLFMKTMHPRITVPYIMLTHGDFFDTTFNESLRYLNDEKIIAWFSIHPPKQGHPKYYPIPLGVFQKKAIGAQGGSYNKYFKELRYQPKQKLLTGLFFSQLKHNPERLALIKKLKPKSFYTHIKTALPFEDYLKVLASSVFTLSPRGWGPDCYRTWEALLVGTIPIVKRGQHDVLDSVKKLFKSGEPAIRAQLDKLYEQLPILVIDEWSEITQEFLEKKYKEITSKKYNLEILYIDYWSAVIKAVKEEYIKNYVR